MYITATILRYYHNYYIVTLSVKPSSGTGVPHFRSRVMHRVFRPLFTQDSAMLFAFDVHIPSENALSRCAVKRSTSCKPITEKQVTMKPHINWLTLHTKSTLQKWWPLLFTADQFTLLSSTEWSN